MKTDVAVPSVSRPVAVGLGAFGMVFIVVAVLVMRSRPPQMGAHPEVFRTVDALYSAIRMQDEVKLGQCARRLRSQGTDGKLAAEAGAYLADVITMAESGKWEAAADQLYKFMLAQRREEAEPTPKKKVGGKTVRK